jgi:hypothetical protein
MSQPVTFAACGGQRSMQSTQYFSSLNFVAPCSTSILCVYTLTDALLLCTIHCTIHTLCMHYSMAAALAYMHHEADRDYAYIFRDLKPENCEYFAREFTCIGSLACTHQ